MVTAVLNEPRHVGKRSKHKIENYDILELGVENGVESDLYGWG